MKNDYIITSSNKTQYVVDHDIYVSDSLIKPDSILESLLERITQIEKILLIPQRNIELEQKYPELKQLYKAYMKKLDELTTWESLKND